MQAYLEWEGRPTTTVFNVWWVPCQITLLDLETPPCEPTYDCILYLSESHVFSFNSFAALFGDYLPSTSIVRCAHISPTLSHASRIYLFSPIGPTPPSPRLFNIDLEMDYTYSFMLGLADANAAYDQN